MKWLLALLLLCSCAARGQRATEGPPLALIHADIIDGAADDVLRDATVLIRDPLADIAALQSLALVVHDGTVVLNRLTP